MGIPAVWEAKIIVRGGVKYSTLYTPYTDYISFTGFHVETCFSGQDIMLELPRILYWEDPVQTGAIFGTVLVSMVSLSYFSLITVASHICLTVLMFVVGVKLYSHAMVMLKKAEPGFDPLASVAAISVTVPEDTISDLSPYVAETLNNLTAELRRLFLVENLLDTLKFGMSLWLLTYVGSWFNFLTLIILAWLGFFTLPKLYINNQAQVDDVIAKLRVQAEELKGKVIAMIPNKAAAKEESIKAADKEE